MMYELSISSTNGAYPVRIGPGMLQSAGEFLRDKGVGQGTKVFVVTDESLYALGYANDVADSCRTAGFDPYIGVVPPGDESKCLAMAERLFHEMVNAGIRRNGVVLAVGGGVIGDLGGFVAATYQRGVRFVQMPTTLLAHDSSIGGKVGVNLPFAKNLIGVFHPPIGVLYDVGALSSLPSSEWCGGMAEVIKHGMIGNVPLFESLEKSPVTVFPGVEEAAKLIYEAMAVKVAIVERDERESELRMVLNLGHTVGHAIEQLSHYTVHHGQGVAMGICIESDIAEARGWMTRDEHQRVVNVFQSHGLPVDAPSDMDFDEIVQVLNLDKKHGNEGWTFALPRGIGQVAIARDVTRDELQAAWNRSKAKGTGGTAWS